MWMPDFVNFANMLCSLPLSRCTQDCIPKRHVHLPIPLTCHERCFFLLSKGISFFLFVCLKCCFLFSIVLLPLPLPHLVQLDLIFCKRKHGSLNANIFASFMSTKVAKTRKKKSNTKKIIIFLQLLCALHTRFVNWKRKKKLCWNESSDRFFALSSLFFLARLSAVVMISVTVVRNCLC